MTTRKTFSRVEIKDADKGQVTAAFSTFDVIDKDMDVTRPGAFDEGVKVVISAYGHTSWDGALPVGSGTIQATKTEAILDGQFFLDTRDGADTFTAVKRLAEDGLGEWSYGYDPIEYSFGEFNDQRVRFLDKLKVYEVSPVLLGAGVNTRTLAAKGLRFDEHGQALLAELDDFIDRAMRAAKDKPLRQKSTALLQQVDDRLKTLHEMLGKSTPPDSDSDAETLRKEFLRFMARPLAS
jgi:HK97 family phage prohead protease